MDPFPISNPLFSRVRLEFMNSCWALAEILKDHVGRNAANSAAAQKCVANHHRTKHEVCQERIQKMQQLCHMLRLLGKLRNN